MLIIETHLILFRLFRNCKNTFRLDVAYEPLPLTTFNETNFNFTNYPLPRNTLCTSNGAGFHPGEQTQMVISGRVFAAEHRRFGCYGGPRSRFGEGRKGEQ